MSEMMTTEILVEAEWILKDYWTKGRFPVQTSKGGWSDFDVVAFHPSPSDPELKRKSHLVLSEAKSFGTRNQVYVTTAKNQDYTFKNIESLWSEEEKTDPYFSFLRQIKVIDGPLLDLIQNSVQIVTIQLVSNWMIDQEVKGNIESRLAKKVKEVLISKQLKDKTVNCIIETPLEVFERIMKGVKDDIQGRRYGNPILDLAREFNRYLNPSYLQKRNFSRKEEFLEYTTELFKKMFPFCDRSSEKK
ncbi:MAG: hypothetical protein ACYCRD_09445 [Leptospirillum sp.]